MIHRRAVAVIATVLLTGLLAGLGACSATNATPAAESSASARTVTDPAGKTVEIPGNVRRAFGMYTSDLDYAITLGLPLAPVQSIREGSVGFPDFFPQEPLQGIEPLVNFPEFEYEKIAAAEPDVIINGLGYEGGPDGRKLAAIAPTFTYDGFDGDWRDDFKAVAAAFGKEQVAEAFLQQVSARTGEVKAKVAALGEAPTVAYGYYYPGGNGEFIGSAPDNLIGQVLAEVGIKPSKAVGKDWTEISHEKIPDLADVDLLMIAVDTDSDQDKVLAALRKDPIWSKLPAVKAGHVVAVNNELSYASPHAHLEFLNVLERDLALLPG